MDQLCMLTHFQNSDRRILKFRQRTFRRRASCKHAHLKSFRRDPNLERRQLSEIARCCYRVVTALLPPWFSPLSRLLCDLWRLLSTQPGRKRSLTRTRSLRCQRNTSHHSPAQSFSLRRQPKSGNRACREHGFG